MQQEATPGQRTVASTPQQSLFRMAAATPQPIHIPGHWPRPSTVMQSSARTRAQSEGATVPSSWLLRLCAVPCIAAAHIDAFEVAKAEGAAIVVSAPCLSTQRIDVVFELLVAASLACTRLACAVVTLVMTSACRNHIDTTDHIGYSMVRVLVAASPSPWMAVRSAMKRRNWTARIPWILVLTSPRIKS